jgi:hypothetical protein
MHRFMQMSNRSLPIPLSQAPDSWNRDSWAGGEADSILTQRSLLLHHGVLIRLSPNPMRRRDFAHALDRSLNRLAFMTAFSCPGISG